MDVYGMRKAAVLMVVANVFRRSGREMRLVELCEGEGRGYCS